MIPPPRPHATLSFERGCLYTANTTYLYYILCVVSAWQYIKYKHGAILRLKTHCTVAGAARVTTESYTYTGRRIYKLYNNNNNVIIMYVKLPRQHRPRDSIRTYRFEYYFIHNRRLRASAGRRAARPVPRKTDLSVGLKRR